MQQLKDLYITNRFFLGLAVLIVLFALSFAVPGLYYLVVLLLIVYTALATVDIYLLFSRNTELRCQRQLPRLFNLGDENTVRLQLENNSNQRLQLCLIEELPVQFQKRDFEQRIRLEAGEKQELRYPLRPLTRGAYRFGLTNVFASGRLGLFERRLRYHTDPMEVPVYPSILQMKQMELLAFNRVSTQKGLKKIRRIGHSYEFEQIKNYVRGDDYRSINWKASSRRGALMVNQYEDERAQQMYCLIDKSRAMHMPFQGLSLVDYAINTSLVMANLALQKYDKAGLITFSDKLGTVLKADSKATQLNKILTALYKEQTRELEANYELLYFATRKFVTARSLLLLFSNFESIYALERVLPILRKMNRTHLLVVVFFENSEIRAYTEQRAATLEDIYSKSVARNFLAEKQQMVQVLRQYGIQSILTKPEELSFRTVNKYLELKSRGLI